MLNQATEFFKAIRINYLLAVCASLVFSQTYASEIQEEKKLSPHLRELPIEYFSKQSGKLGDLSQFPKEIIEEIFSYCSQEAEFINGASFTIITGYKTEDISKKGVTTLPTYKTYPFLPYNRKVNVRKHFPKPNKIPSYFWYRRIRSVVHIPEELWQYLRYSNIHEVDLRSRGIGPEGAKKFAKALQGTRVHTINLRNNNIGPDGTKTFVEALKGTNVHTVNLSDNNIADEGAGKVAKALQGTNIHTVYLGSNKIGDDGVKEFFQSLQGTNVRIVDLNVNNIGNKGLKDFAKVFQGTNVHTINLDGNKLGSKMAKKFAKALQGTNVHTIDLSSNDIDEEGAEQLAQVLKNTNVRTVDLRNNEINDYDTERLLKEHYSSITWVFDIVNSDDSY